MHREAAADLMAAQHFGVHPILALWCLSVMMCAYVLLTVLSVATPHVMLRW